MDIFISWSGQQSENVATDLKNWLIQLFPTIKIFISKEIKPGKRGLNEIAKVLKKSSFGVICATDESIIAPWVLFESGCISISESIEYTHVIPYLIDISGDKLSKNPIGQFQYIKSDKDGTYALVKTIYGIYKKLENDNRDEFALKESFETNWPKLEEKLVLIKEKYKKKDTNCHKLNIGKDAYELIRNIHHYIFYHQGRLIEYLFLAGEQHKKLKETFNKSRKIKKNIKNEYDTLTNFINKMIMETFEISINELKKVFSGRKSMLPRICLKVAHPAL